MAADIMEIKESIQQIVSLFEQLKEQDPRCGSILCSTCGGNGTAVREQLAVNDLKNIDDVLSRISSSELNMFGVWAEILEKINPYGIASVHAREAKAVDLSDIRTVDNFLFRRRYDYESSLYEKDYLNILKQAIPMAIETSDASLIETLVIVLGEQASEYQELVSIAISLSEDDKEMQRVLYNCLRESVPAVRGYVVNGCSPFGPINPWY